MNLIPEADSNVCFLMPDIYEWNENFIYQETDIKMCSQKNNAFVI